MALSLSFVSSKNKEVNCQGLNIDIADFDESRFVTRKDVINLLGRNNFKYIGLPVVSVNTLKAESLLYYIPAIKQIEAYTTVDGNLNIHIEQRKPLIRIVDRSFHSYYIDVEGTVMPISEYFSAYTLVANGNIHEPIAIRRNQSIFSFDSTGAMKHTQLTDLYELASFINNDDLWNSQIEQIYVNVDNEYILTPRVGSHTIILGDGKNIKGKLKKLKNIYKVLNTIGWNTYSTINLKFKNQVVCTKH